MKKIAIFDLDGTLLNTLESIAHCGNSILKEFNIDTLEVNTYSNFIGHGADNLIKQLTEYVKLPSEDFALFKEKYLAFYKQNGSYNVAPYDGIPELLKTLKEKGIKLAILSNKPDSIVKDCIDLYFEKNTFDAVYGQKAGIPVKPDTTHFFEILNSLGISSEDCIYCGDSKVDIDTGKNAGALALGAAWGFYGDKPFSDADAILYSPLDMLKYI